MFTDVVASSRLRRGKGESAAQQSIRALQGLIRSEIAAHNGREVKSTGDGFMIAFASTLNAVKCAVAIERAVAAGRPGGLPKVRIGINVGEVIEEDGDLFGLAVDAAEHIQSKAKGGQILVSELVRGVVGAADSLEFVERGRFQLKNFPGRWRLYEVPWQPDPPARRQQAFAFLVCDLVGSGAIAERLGDEKALDVLLAYYAMIRAQLLADSVRWTKGAGDNFYAALDSAPAALAAAVAIQRTFAAREHEHLGTTLPARMALHYGQAILEADDLFGQALFTVVRLSAVAEEGQILVSSQFREQVPDADVEFVPQPAVELRGLRGTHEVYEVRW